MGPYYEKICVDLGFPKDAALSAKLTATNEADLAKIEATIKDATDNLGETEVSDALISKANHFSRIGDSVKAVEAYVAALAKTSPLGHKIDLHFSVIRVGFFTGDVALISSYIESVKMFTLELT